VVAGLGQQLIGAGGAVEPAHGFLGEAELPHDRLDPFPLSAQRLDLLITVPGAPGQDGLFCPVGGGRGSGPGQIGGRVAGSSRAGPGLGLWLRLGQAAPVPGDLFLHVFGQVVPQVPAIGYLQRIRGAVPGALGVGPGPVPADHRGAGMGAQPVRQRARFPVRQQVHGLAGLHVDQQRAVDAAPAEREIIHAEEAHRPGRRAG